MNLIIWITLVVTPIVTGMFVSGGIGQFIDPPSAFITILPTIGVMIVGFKGYFISSLTSVWKKDVDDLTLAKGVEFESEEQYRGKLDALKESYFTKAPVAESQEVISEDAPVEENSTAMNAYLQALTKFQ